MVRSGYFLSIVLLSITFFASAASGQSGWTLLRETGSGDLVAAYFTSPERGWVAGDDGYLASTQDGGKTWETYPLKTRENINEIYFRNNDNGYIVAGRKLYLTKNAGQSWEETFIVKPGTFKDAVPEFLSIRFADKKRGIAVGSLLKTIRGEEVVVDSLAMRTEDGGDTWTRMILPAKGELFHLDYNGSSHAWIVGDGGVILASTDGGRNWVRQNSGTKLPIYNVDFRDDLEGYAVGKSGTALRTDDGGTTWQKVATGSNETFMRVDFADDKNGWIVGYRGTILKSSDKGKTWVKQDGGTQKNLYGLFMFKRYGFAVGADGVITSYQR